MKKLLLITVDYLPQTGGVANYYARLVKRWPECIAVLTCVPGKTAVGLYREKFIFSFIWPRWLKLLWLIPKYQKITKANTIWVGNILPVGTAVWLWHLFTKVTYILSVHGLDIQLAKRSCWKKWLVSKILSRATKVIANSKFTADLLIDFKLESNKIDYLYPLCLSPIKLDSIVTTKLVKKYNLEKRLIILTVTRLVARKGVDLVLNALVEVAKTNQNWVYVIVGEGPEQDKLAQQVKQYNLPVVITGKVSTEERAAWYNLCDIFVMTPLNDPVDVEGFGMVYVEAMSYSKPVVASRFGGIPEAVGEAGLYADNHLELVAVLTRLLGDHTLRQSLAIKSQQRFNYFSQLPDQTNILFTV